MSQLSLRVTPPPHLHSGKTVPGAMYAVMVALLPITAVSIYVYHFAAVMVMLTAMVSCLVFQWLANAAKKKTTVVDGSAIVTGALLGLCFQPYTPWSTIVVASFLAIVVAKELMGGIGWNRFNPALFGRAGVYILAPVVAGMGKVVPGVGSGVPEAITGATPMMLLSRGMEMPGIFSMLTAYAGGALGEVSAIALFAGAAFLMWKGFLKWRISVTMLATVFVVAALAGQNPFYHLLGGGLLLGALYMATDWTTSPVTMKGQLAFGIAAGLITVLIRLVLPPAEGVAFAILIMNGFVPVLDRALRSLRFGELPSRATSQA